MAGPSTSSGPPLIHLRRLRQLHRLLEYWTFKQILEGNVPRVVQAGVLRLRPKSVCCTFMPAGVALESFSTFSFISLTPA